VEKSFLNDELKLAPITLTATVSDWKAPRMDNLEVSF